MNTTTITAPTPTTRRPTEVHYYCCDPDRGICGTPLDRHLEGADVTCAVCLDLYSKPCRPGCAWEIYG